MTRAEAEREPSSGKTPEEIEKFLEAVFGAEIPSTESLAEEMEAARKRLADSEMGG